MSARGWWRIIGLVGAAGTVIGPLRDNSLAGLVSLVVVCLALAVHDLLDAIERGPDA